MISRLISRYPNVWLGMAVVIIFSVILLVTLNVAREANDRVQIQKQALDEARKIGRAQVVWFRPDKKEKYEIQDDGVVLLNATPIYRVYVDGTYGD